MVELNCANLTCFVATCHDLKVLAWFKEDNRETFVLVNHEGICFFVQLLRRFDVEDVVAIT